MESCKHVENWSGLDATYNDWDGEKCLCEINTETKQRRDAVKVEARKFMETCVASRGEASEDGGALPDRYARVPRHAVMFQGAQCYCGDKSVCEIGSIFTGITSGFNFDCKFPIEIGGKKGLSDITGRTSKTSLHGTLNG